MAGLLPALLLLNHSSSSHATALNFAFTSTLTALYSLYSGIDYFELTPHLQKALRTLSGGTGQKVSAALSLMFNPWVLLFDEPTAGLDPLASSRLKDTILEQKAQGKTILLTSHVMSELEEFADEVLFLLDGQVAFRGTLANIREHSGEEKLERAIAKLIQVSA
jgi:Cu-processing system ATP-binding protein